MVLVGADPEAAARRVSELATLIEERLDENDGSVSSAMRPPGSRPAGATSAARSNRWPPPSTTSARTTCWSSWTAPRSCARCPACRRCSARAPVRASTPWPSTATSGCCPRSAPPWPR
ncbi:hypothetical protein ACFQX6_33595 [Streptosporangium lutulentum]